MSEISPPEYRGRVGGLYNLNINGGYTLTEWMGLGAYSDGSTDSFTHRHVVFFYTLADSVIHRFRPQLHNHQPCFPTFLGASAHTSTAHGRLHSSTARVAQVFNHEGPLR